MAHPVVLLAIIIASMRFYNFSGCGAFIECAIYIGIDVTVARVRFKSSSINHDATLAMWTVAVILCIFIMHFLNRHFI